jgi:hypothetical protein
MKRMRSIPQMGYHKVPVRYFQRGKERRYFIEYMDGKPLDEWIDKNMDPITALKEGRYELLDKLCQEYGYCGSNVPVALSDSKEVEPPF